MENKITHKTVFKKTLMALTLGFLLSLVFSISSFAAGITPTALNDYESSKSGVRSYNLKLQNSNTSMVQQIQMPYAGLLEIDMVSSGLPYSVNFNLYSNAACTSEVGYGGSLSASRLTDNMSFRIPSAGTYYLKISGSRYADNNSPANFSIKPYSYSGADKTLKAGSWTGTYGNDYNQTIYHKITVKKAGYITVQGFGKGYASTPRSSLSVSLTSSGKKALEGKTLYSSNGFTTYHGVKKGTYYIAVKASGHYKLKYNFKAVANKSGASKAKAKTLKKNKTVKGVLYADGSTKKNNWYKVVLPKKKKLTLKVAGKVNNDLKIKIVPKNSKTWLRYSTQYLRTGSGTIKSDSKLPAGTYYIQVCKYRADSSGYYSIKYK